jgi:hypothetical protein
MSPESQIIVDLYKCIKKYLSKPSESAVEGQSLALDTVHELTTEPSGVTYEEARCLGTVSGLSVARV